LYTRKAQTYKKSPEMTVMGHGSIGQLQARFFNKWNVFQLKGHCSFLRKRSRYNFIPEDGVAMKNKFWLSLNETLSLHSQEGGALCYELVLYTTVGRV